MTERLKAVRGLEYPDARSLEIVREAGNLSKLTSEQRSRIRLKRVEPGGWCDDIPSESLQHYLENGAVVSVTVKEKETAKKRRIF